MPPGSCRSTDAGPTVAAPDAPPHHGDGRAQRRRSRQPQPRRDGPPIPGRGVTTFLVNQPTAGVRPAPPGHVVVRSDPFRQPAPRGRHRRKIDQRQCGVRARGAALRSPPRRPQAHKRVQRQGGHLRAEGERHLPEVEHDAVTELVAQPVAQDPQPAQVFGLDAEGRLAFNSEHPAVDRLDHQVDLGAYTMQGRRQAGVADEALRCRMTFPSGSRDQAGSFRVRNTVSSSGR